MIVDSSVWMEIFSQGPLAHDCENYLKNKSVKVPALVIFEIYKKIKQRASEDFALEIVAALSEYESLTLTRDVALTAADLALKHKLGMADSLILAHAQVLQEELFTLDNDFSGLPFVHVLRKSAR